MLWLVVAHAVAALQAPSWSALSKTLPSAAAEAPRPSTRCNTSRSGRRFRTTPWSYIESATGGVPTPNASGSLVDKNVAYETVLIDNTGGARPSWFGSTTRRDSLGRRHGPGRIN